MRVRKIDVETVDELRGHLTILHVDPRNKESTDWVVGYTRKIDGPKVTFVDYRSADQSLPFLPLNPENCDRKIIPTSLISRERTYTINDDSNHFVCIDYGMLNDQRFTNEEYNTIAEDFSDKVNPMLNSNVKFIFFDGPIDLETQLRETIDTINTTKVDGIEKLDDRIKCKSLSIYCSKSLSDKQFAIETLSLVVACDDRRFLPHLSRETECRLLLNEFDFDSLGIFLQIAQRVHLCWDFSLGFEEASDEERMVYNISSLKTDRNNDGQNIVWTNSIHGREEWRPLAPSLFSSSWNQHPSCPSQLWKNLQEIDLVLQSYDINNKDNRIRDFWVQERNFRDSLGKFVLEEYEIDDEIPRDGGQTRERALWDWLKSDGASHLDDIYLSLDELEIKKRPDGTMEEIIKYVDIYNGVNIGNGIEIDEPTIRNRIKRCIEFLLSIDGTAFKEIIGKVQKLEHIKEHLGGGVFSTFIEMINYQFTPLLISDILKDISDFISSVEKFHLRESDGPLIDRYGIQRRKNLVVEEVR